jgi:hypothetical protein
MSQERRLHQRFVVELAVEITAGEHRFTAVTKDISVSGCCVAGPYPLPEESTVLCALYLVLDGIEEADLSALETRATVQWAADTAETGSDERHMAGLKFDGLSQAQQDWLQGTIAKVEASKS